MNIDRFVQALKGKKEAVAQLATSFKSEFSEFEQSIFQRTFNSVLEQTGDEAKAMLAGQGAVNRFRQGMSYKAKKASDNVEGWGVMFGNPELKDTDNVYFDPDTEFLLEYYSRAPLFFEHCQDAQYGVMPIGERVSVEKHEHGLWVVHRLFQDHPLYAKTVAMLEAGELSYSSDTASHLAIKGLQRDGGLKFWPLVSFALVRSPAEPGLGKVISR